MIANTVIVLLLIALCCQIPLIKTSDVNFKFHKVNFSAIRISVDSGRLPFNQITVNYQLTVSDTEDICETNNTQISEFSDNYTARCEKDLYLFGDQALGLSESYPLIKRYCGFKTTTSLCNSSIVLSDLMPSSIYEIEVAVRDVREKSGNRTVNKSVHRICTDLDLPIWNGQTDFGSFQIISQENAKRKVILYWRKVPKILHSREQLIYSVNCRGSNDERRERLRHYTKENFWDFDGLIKATSSYECRVRTENSKGSSENSPMIFIPEQSKVVKAPPGSKISIRERANDKVEVSWTKYGWVGNNSHYTLYLCDNKNGLDCRMIRLDEFLTSIEIRKSVLRGTTLGLSFNAPGANYSTGVFFPPQNSPSRRRALEERYKLYRND